MCPYPKKIVKTNLICASGTMIGYSRSDLSPS